MPDVIDVVGGGTGGEAEVRIQFRKVFPGIGGTVRIQQSVMSAWRKEFNQAFESGKKLFLKHLLLKKLDDYFTRTGRYFFPHITRPLGSSGSKDDWPEGYWYQWVFGQESFPWEYPKTDGGREVVTIDEWAKFTSAFAEAGVNLSADVCDANNGLISQNIIHELYKSFEVDLNFCWKRIDFGAGSMGIDYDRLCKFFETNAMTLGAVLGGERVTMMILAAEYLSGQLRGSSRELDRLTAIYRLSTLRQNTAEILMP